MMIRGFEAIETPSAKVLVLGTIPGKQSLATGQYYANRGNAFWFIMDRLFESKADLDYQARLSALVRAKVAVWDVLESANRHGSADSAIVAGSETPNDFQAFFAHHASVRAVFFNGAAAEKLFRRFVLTTLPERGRGLVLKRLPSTSSANTHLTKEGKLEAWKAIKDSSADG
jgi:hypoxanthine-DNA glycosylase